MKALIKLTILILVAYFVYRLLTEFARPVSVRLGNEVESGSSYAEPPISSKPASPPASRDPQSQRVNLNEVDASTLTALPGVGPVLAERIVAYREENGPFKQTTDLTKVSGIGSALEEGLRPFVVLS